MSFHQALDLIFELDEAAVECTRDILRQRFVGVSFRKLATGRLVNGSSCDEIDMVIPDLDLEPKRIVLGSIPLVQAGLWELMPNLTGNGYSRKGQKPSPKGQNRTRNGKDRERQSHSKPKVKSQPRENQSQYRQSRSRKSEENTFKGQNCQYLKDESPFFWTIPINITSPSSPLVQTSSMLDDWGTNPSDSKNESSLRTFSVMNEIDR
nr:hypothetical protein [Tanacetum cinerariifolium]